MAIPTIRILDHLAADVVDDLVVHLHPHPVDQGAVARQKAAQAAHQYPLVFEHKEDHQRYQNEVDHDGDHVDQRAEGCAHQMLAATEDTLANIIDDGLHQTDVDELGVFVRQGAHIILSVGQHGGRLFGQIDPLTDQRRDKTQQGGDCYRNKEDQNDAGGQGARQPRFLQPGDRPLKQIGHYQCHQQGGQQIAKQPDDGEAEHQQQEKGNGIGIGKTGLIPALQYF